MGKPKDKQQKDQSEIDDVVLQEKRRGRRPIIDIESRRAHAQLVKDVRRHLERGTEEEFVNTIRAAGLVDGSPRFLEVLRLWRQSRLS
jgi:hypothetical protein